MTSVILPPRRLSDRPPHRVRNPQPTDKPPFPDSVKAFPEIAWRGLFKDYREAMCGTTEASDVAHFATFWAAVAVMLGRNIHMYSGDFIYPNAYIAFFGPTGDKKTTAQRRITSCNLLEHTPNVPVIQNAGSTEGLADRLTPGGPCLLMWEEFATFLAVARWAGSTLLQFLTETYDCPRDWKRDFRKNKIELDAPTPTVLTMTTPEWFWLHAKVDDFFGGFGNRFTYFCGSAKAAIPNPDPVNDGKICHIKTRIREFAETLAHSQHRRAHWTPQAQIRWDKFYCALHRGERKGILGAALKRMHVHVRKLCMVYAFLENTLPEIQEDQLQAAIAVNAYAAQCAKQLIAMQSQPPESEARREMEIRIMEWAQKHPGERLRSMQRSLCRQKGDSESLHRVIRSLVNTDQIELRADGRTVRVHPI